MSSLTNSRRERVVAVTGAARGIGRNIARSFARQGARVVLCDIDERGGVETRDQFRTEGWLAEFEHVNLSEKGAPQAMIREIANQWGRVDVLVNNARSGSRRTLIEETEDTWDAGLAVTLKAAFFASQAVIALMKDIGGASIVNMSSVAALVACNESPAYHIAKAGMLQMTRYLAAFAGPFGIRVNAVLPGFIVQDEHRGRYAQEDNREYREIAEFCHPVGRIGSSDDVANTVTFLCSPQASFISGQALVVDGGAIVNEQTGLLYRFDRTWNPET